jgi:YtkA-like protein
MTSRLRLLAVTASIALALGTTPVPAGAAEYVFEPVSVDIRNGSGSELAVRLVHKPTGKPVDGAVLFRTRLDMSPDSMGEMTAKHAALTSTEPGVYKFRADLTMAGGWAFKLMAKVPGETETVQGTVVFKAR